MGAKDIHIFVMNMTFISSSEEKKYTHVYFMSGETMNEIGHTHFFFFFFHFIRCSIIRVEERLYKVLGQIGLKLWFPRQPKLSSH